MRRGDPDGPSLVEAVGRLPAEAVEPVVAYLQAGWVFASTPGRLVDDVLNPDRRDVATAIQRNGGPPVLDEDGRLHIEAELFPEPSPLTRNSPGPKARRAQHCVVRGSG